MPGGCVDHAGLSWTAYGVTGAVMTIMSTKLYQTHYRKNLTTASLLGQIDHDHVSMNKAGISRHPQKTACLGLEICLDTTVSLDHVWQGGPRGGLQHKATATATIAAGLGVFAICYFVIRAKGNQYSHSQRRAGRPQLQPPPRCHAY